MSTRAPWAPMVHPPLPAQHMRPTREAVVQARVERGQRPQGVLRSAEIMATAELTHLDGLTGR